MELRTISGSVRFTKRIWTGIIGLLLVVPPARQLLAQEVAGKPAPEPEILFIFPLGAQQGVIGEAEIHGKNLAGAYLAYSSPKGLNVRIRSVEGFPSPGGGKAGENSSPQEDRIRLEVGPESLAGAYSLRLVSPGGISNTAGFSIHECRAVAEFQTPHQTPDEAQRISPPVTGRSLSSSSGARGRP